MKKENKEPTKPYTGIKMLLKSKGLKILDVYMEMKETTDIDITLSSFYNFCNGQTFTRKAKMINWIADRLGITSEALLGFYIVSGPTRAEKDAQRPENIQKQKVKDKLKDSGEVW